MDSFCLFCEHPLKYWNNRQHLRKEKEYKTGVHSLHAGLSTVSILLLGLAPSPYISIWPFYASLYIYIVTEFVFGLSVCILYNYNVPTKLFIIHAVHNQICL